MSKSQKFAQMLSNNHIPQNDIFQMVANITNKLQAHPHVDGEVDPIAAARAIADFINELCDDNDEDFETEINERR